MRLVSLLTSYHTYKQYGYSTEQSEAQKLVRECEADASQWTSEICHKIGKYYGNYKVRPMSSFASGQKQIKDF